MKCRILSQIWWTLIRSVYKIWTKSIFLLKFIYEAATCLLTRYTIAGTWMTSTGTATWFRSFYTECRHPKCWLTIWLNFYSLFFVHLLICQKIIFDHKNLVQLANRLRWWQWRHNWAPCNDLLDQQRKVLWCVCVLKIRICFLYRVVKTETIHEDTYFG